MNSTVTQWLECVRRAFSPASRDYVRLLEDDVARAREEVSRERAETERERAVSERLRLENRAMLNSLLGTAGVPPVEEPRPQPSRLAGAVRRRSWPQFAAARENEAGRQARTRDAL